LLEATLSEQIQRFNSLSRGEAELVPEKRVEKREREGKKVRKEESSSLVDPVCSSTCGANPPEVLTR